jgi:ABC-type transport system involved in multi-copper enzyme maturation permease subunit
MVGLLVRKDCDLMKGPVAAYTATALAGFVLAASGHPTGRAMGITLALNVMIGVSFHVALGPVLGERERKTLAFVMSLPVTPREATAAKMISAFVLFLIPAMTAATALVFLSPVDIFGVMATSDRSIASHLAGWVAYYGIVLGAWAVVFSIVLGAAIVSESIGWTIAVLTGTIFVFGNVVLQLAPTLGWVGRYVRDLARGGATLPATMAAEAAALALVVGATLILQGRKTSFV